jgi:hypothetical protein
MVPIVEKGFTGGILVGVEGFHYDIEEWRR